MPAMVKTLKIPKPKANPSIVFVAKDKILFFIFIKLMTRQIDIRIKYCK